MRSIEHSWNVSPEEAEALQIKLAPKVRIEPIKGAVRSIAGVDCAYSDDDGTIICAAVLLEAESLKVIATACAEKDCGFPYIPGLLSFREAPAAIEAVSKLPEKADILMCEGHGISHPRGFGLACHVGLWLEIPTIGIAKNRLCGDCLPPDKHRGSRSKLICNGRIAGTVLRTQTGVKPIFVSAGHRITLKEAVHWALHCSCEARMPQPIRLAHQEASKHCK